jgi:predicted transcriptional regulator
MTTQEMLMMRMNGATYQEIADECGVSRQNVNERIHRYTKRLTSGVRGYGFSLYDIRFKAIREHFEKNPKETVSSFSRATGVLPQTMRNFLTGTYESFFTVHQIRRMCEIVGKPFEEIFGGAEDESETDR